MPQGTNAAAPASRRVPAALLTLINLGAGQTVPWRIARKREHRSADYFERLKTGQGRRLIPDKNEECV